MNARMYEYTDAVMHIQESVIIMKLLLEPIDVSAKASIPTAFCWRGRLFEVENILETWSARGEWWGREDQREYYMLMTTRGVMEIYLGREGWMLSRIYD